MTLKLVFFCAFKWTSTHSSLSIVFNSLVYIIEPIINTTSKDH